jgi:hypothetical protein
MKTTSRSKGPPEQRLCILAREFRGTRDEQQRTSIAKEYAQAVGRLINSKKWRRIPPLEDQLPDEWMPDAFFEYWSLLTPLRRTAKSAIVTEGSEDVAILRALLPAELLNACDLQSARGLPNLASHARAHLAKHHAPTVILLDTNTLDQVTIVKMVKDMRGRLGSAAVGIPFDVVCCIPHISVFFLASRPSLPRRLLRPTPSGSSKLSSRKAGGHES